MELLRTAHRKTRLSEVIYITLNIAFAIAVYAAIVIVNSLPLAVSIIILSKWRMLAVRPRFWAVNILTNLVDIIVGISVVTLLWSAHDATMTQIGLTVLYIVWLLLIKPRSKRAYIALQAGTAIFLGVTALATVGYSIDAGLYVALIWVIGYSASKHYLGSYDHEPLINIYSLVWSLVFVEYGWLMYHWTFAYAVPGLGGVKLVQGAIILTLMSFVVERMYSLPESPEERKVGDVIAPIVFSASIIILLVVFFNSVTTIGG